ncbi:fasciclin-like arabinogalactan protein 1 [Phragmites australis]|uniref:fasciclin-like arabinogalactan protein 1 n=1 Tax=Phragmites australis TaxID=29695 RepID=UPI002D7A19EC|nr:fasciclin-like arabinogalactan protein 1 [Phragmites australis]
MPLAEVVTASTVLLPLLLVLSASPLCHGASGHNITAILAAHPNFTEFSGALSRTGVAAEIDRRTTITVLAVDNVVMAQLQARRLKPDDFLLVISLQILLDYFDAAKLGSLQGGFAQVTSLYQASGKAPGSDGILNITTHPGGRVTFAQSGPSDAPPPAFYQKYIQETPYDIAVLQVSALISSRAAEAQAPAPPPDAALRLTDLLSKNGCGGFACLLAATADAAATYDRSIGAGHGLTVFCPEDKAVSAFNPTFKNLTADGQLALLLYHGVAVHYSEQSLKEINGDVNTLSTEGGKNYSLTIRADGETVKLSSTAPSTARVIKTVLDKAPLAVYLIDALLLPRELINNGQGRTAPSPAPVAAPAHAPTLNPVPVLAPPAPAATLPPVPVLAPPAPSPVPTPSRRPVPPPEHAPAPSPDEDNAPPADEKNNGASGMASWTIGAAVAAAAPTIVLLL